MELTDGVCTSQVPSVSQEVPEKSGDRTSDLPTASDLKPVTYTVTSSDVGSTNGEIVNSEVDRPTYTQTDEQTVFGQVDETSFSLGARSVTQSENPGLSTKVRSRFSCIVKLVDRLIQTMSRQDIVHTCPSMRSVCRSVFQVFRDQLIRTCRVPYSM